MYVCMTISQKNQLNKLKICLAMSLFLRHHPRPFYDLYETLIFVIVYIGK